MLESQRDETKQRTPCITINRSNGRIVEFTIASSTQRLVLSELGIGYETGLTVRLYSLDIGWLCYYPSKTQPSLPCSFMYGLFEGLFGWVTCATSILTSFFAIVFCVFLAFHPFLIHHSDMLFCVRLHLSPGTACLSSPVFILLEAGNAVNNPSITRRQQGRTEEDHEERGRR